MLNQIDEIYGKFGRKFYQLIFDRALNIDQFYPENEHALLYTRIVTSPTHAKAMLETTQKKSIEQHEESFGII